MTLLLLLTGSSASAPGVPLQRQLIIDEEDRSMTIYNEDRLYEIDSENRTVIVKGA